MGQEVIKSYAEVQNFKIVKDDPRDLGKLRVSGIEYTSQIISGASLSLTEADSGKTIFVGTDAASIQLPAAKSGLRYTFVNKGTDGAVGFEIAPASGEKIHGTITLASSVVELDGNVDDPLENVKATATTGNSVTLESDGVAWYVISSTGIWATG